MIFDDETINRIWEKGRTVEGVDPSKFRKDACGAWIARNKFRKGDSEFGWVVDHIYPRSMGGGDDLVNLRPLNIQNNISKSNSYPAYVACVTSSGEKNIRKLRTKIVNLKKQQILNELFGAKK